MDTDIFGFSWWITIVVAALIINLASSYLKPVLDTFFRLVRYQSEPADQSG